ncbi:MAG: conjugal transfer protein TraG N-terminal domain-containing protein [Simkania negevensis]|nr:conjugal transfer protein TraG N-terminal domain-containing protein [Simkania negevensis]
MKLRLSLSVLALFLVFQAVALPAYAQSASLLESGSKDTAIHTYGGGELLAKVFNAIAMLIYGNAKTGIGKTFHSILRIALAFGGFSTVCLAFFREKFEPIIRYFFFPAIAVTGLLLVPRTEIYVQDHLVQKTQSAKHSSLIKIDNVPFFLGKVASLISSLSFKLTETLEGVTHGTNDDLYNWTGHIYAGENLFQAKKIKISSPVLEDNFREFCRECAWRDIGLGLYSKDELMSAKNLLSFLEERTSKIRTMLFREVTTNKNTSLTKTAFISCKEAITRMNNLFNRVDANTKQILLGEIGSDIGFLLGQSKKGGDELKKLMKQQIAIDLLKEEMPGTLGSFASKRAEIQQRENQKTLGALGVSTIVALRNFFEALVYMIFPLVIILSLFPSGIKTLLSWLQFLLWINIWPVFYVVVNFLLSTLWNYRRNHLWGEQVDLTLFTSEGLSELYNSMESIAALAIALIPFLSWALIKGGVSQMVHLASSLTDL